MNRHFATAAAIALSVFGGSAAFAQEATQDFPAAAALSTSSRAEVKSQLAQARLAGDVSYGEASPEPTAASSLSKSDVMAQTQDARRHGQLGFNEAGQARAA